MIIGSGAGSVPLTKGSGSLPRTYGSGSATQLPSQFLIGCRLPKGSVRGQGADEAREQAAALLQGPHEEVGRRPQAQQAVHQEGSGGLPDRTREQVQVHPVILYY
jgi:hypothetical protein